MELTDLRWEYDVDRLCEYLHAVLGESMVSAAVPRPEAPTLAPHRRAAGPQGWSMATALVAGAALAGPIGAALTQGIYNARPTRAIELGLPAWQWLAELGERLGPYAAQRAIELAVVVAAVLAVAAAVRWRAGGAGPSRRVVVWGLCTGALAGLADAITYMLLRYVAGWFEHPLNLGVSRAVGAALVGVVVARAVRPGFAGVAALAAAGGAFLVGASSEAMGVQRVGVAALQAALVRGGGGRRRPGAAGLGTGRARAGDVATRAAGLR